jgi:hypothetical protein
MDFAFEQFLLSLVAGMATGIGTISVCQQKTAEQLSWVLNMN